MFHSNSSRAALECRNGVFRRDWLWCISWQRLDGPGQQEAFQFRRLLALPSKPESTLGGSSGRPGHSAITSIVTRDMLGLENVGHETRGFDANGPAEFHTLLETSENRRREDVFGTLLPGSDGTARLDFLTEDQPNDYVQTAKREEEEGGDEGEAVYMMGENCSPNSIVIQGQIRTVDFNDARTKEVGLTSTE